MLKFLLIILYLTLNIAYADVYKWIDENGKTVYGDKPASDQADKIELKKNPEQDKHYQERVNKQKKLLDVIQEEREERISLKNEALDKKKKQIEKCEKIKRELQNIKNASLLYEDTEDPNNPKIYSDEERQAEENKYNTYIKKHC